ncbi:MAG: chemotaxis protein CheD [Lachnospiraceae bacterium]|nr:chemotaxis protein CheD [Lachnospiraceae bacterium]
MEKCDVIIGIAQLHVSRAPGRIVTIGLGSCVGVTLYDPINHIGGMVHIMLSDSKKFAINRMGGEILNKGKYADTGIEELLTQMIAIGADRRNIVAKIAGGAQMFEIKEGNDILSIGEKNIEASKNVLENLGICVVAEDTGMDYGRTIELNLDNGDLLVRTVTQKEKYI